MDPTAAILNAGESFQRLLGEHRGPPEHLAPVMTLLTYARRFTASTATLALSRRSIDAARPDSLAAFAPAVDAALDDLHQAVDRWRGPRHPSG